MILLQLGCYIIDDEQHSIDVISRYIKDTPGLVLIGTSTSPLEALNILYELDEPPNVVFLDVDMAELSGISFASIVKNLFLIVFITGSNNFAAEAFEHDVVDYLLKPVSYQKFLKSIDRIRAKSKNNKQKEADFDDEIYIKSEIKGKVIRISCKDIIYIESLNKIINIYTEVDVHTTYVALSEIEKHLPMTHFLRVHKSYIVNLKKINSIEGNIINLFDQRKVTIGITYRDILFNTLRVKLVNK